MIQNKKIFREAAAEIAKAKGISFTKAKRLLYSGIMNEYWEQGKSKPPQQLQGFWQNIFKENGNKNE